MRSINDLAGIIVRRPDLSRLVRESAGTHGEMYVGPRFASVINPVDVASIEASMRR